MEEYKSNSDKSRQAMAAAPEKKIEPIVSGTAHVKKKSEIRKIADIFLPKDVRDVKSYILEEVLAPGVKKIIWEIISNSVHMSLFGNAADNSEKRSGSRYAYNRCYDDRNSKRNESSYSRSSSRTSFDEIVFDTRGEAERVLDEMKNILNHYDKMVSVSDLYNLADITAPYTGNRYGWTSLENVRPIRISDGYILDLPRPMPFD